MTVPATTRRAGPFTGNGVTTAFPFLFKMFDAADLAVTLTVDGVDTLLVLDSDYSVSLNADQDATPGGTVTYSTLATGETLVIISALEYEQTADLPTGGAFSPVVVENALDRQTIQVQQLAEQLGRALTLPVSSASANTTLPSPEAAKVIGWDADANALVNYSATEFAAAAAYATATTQIEDGGAASYTLSSSPGVIGNTWVSVDGVAQTPGVDYTLSGVVLTPTPVWPTGTGNVVIRYTEFVLSEEFAAKVGGNVFTGQQSITFVTLTDAATINTDAALGNNFRVTLGGNRTLANPTNLADGAVLNFKVKQDATGTRTLTYGSKFKWPGGSVPPLSPAANAVDLICAQYDSADDILLCNMLRAFA